MDKNFTYKHQVKHRSIRFFKDQPVEPELLELFYEVVRRTATSTSMQMSSIVRVTDPELKQAISEVSKQKYIAKAPELWIFLVDVYRHMQIANDKDPEGSYKPNMEQFFQGAADAYLSAQNLTNSIESYGLGATFLGSILNDPGRIVEILDLPEYTFPMVGMIFGYPNDDPQMKPRMDMKYRIGENTYPRYDDILSELKEYDEEMTHYYDTRNSNRREDTFTDQVLKKIANTAENRKKTLRFIKAQGFDLYLEDGPEE